MKSRLLAAVGIASVVAGLAGVLSAQTSASPAFEVASVKPNPSDRACVFEPNRPGRAYIRGCPVARLIRYAYDLLDYEVVGVPGWNSSASFDINASYPDGRTPTRHEALVMLQHLLAERFQLVAHHEQRPAPIYALVLARTDGKLGKAMNRSSIDCEKWIAEGRSRTDEGVPSPLTPNHKRNACGTAPGPDFLVGGTATTAELASRLEVIVGRRVVDRTGLTGGFDFDLQFSRIPLTAAAATNATAAPSGDAPLIFTAIQEQLGLKLESTTAPLDVLVVDHVEHPTED